MIVCRSLYHPDLSLSLARLSDHLGDEGVTVVAHPIKDWKKFIHPESDSSSKMSLVQIVKSFPRKFSRFLEYQYNLFSIEDFEKYGRQHFDSVKVSSIAYGTHNLVTLRK